LYSDLISFLISLSILSIFNWEISNDFRDYVSLG